MKNKYSLKKLLNEEFESAGRSSDTSGLKGAVGGGAAQYIVSSYISSKSNIKISVIKGDGGIETAGVSTGAPDVKVPYGGKNYEIEVKHGSGRFDLQTVIENQTKKKVKNGDFFTKKQANQALAEKIRRDSILVICEGSGTDNKPKMGMSYMYVLGISDAAPKDGEPAIDKATAKALFGVDIPFLSSADIAAGVTQNPTAKTRKRGTRIERSISEANMKALKAKKIPLTGAKIVTPQAAHTLFVSKYLQVAKKSPVTYRNELAKKLNGITAQEILCMQVATFSDGSSAFASCWNGSKGIYIPMVPNVSKDKYAPFVEAIQNDLPEFRKRFKEIMGKSYKSTMTLEEVLKKSGVSPGPSDKVIRPDAVDKTLSAAPGSKTKKKKAKKDAVRAFDNTNEISDGFLDILENMTKTALRKGAATANRALEKDDKIKGLYAKGANVLEILKIMTPPQRAAFATATGIELEELKEKEPTAAEDLVKIDDSADPEDVDDILTSISKSTKYKGKRLDRKYNSFESGYVPKKSQSVNPGGSTDDWTLDRYRGIVDMLNRISKGKDWRQAFPTPASFAALAPKDNKIDIADFKALLKRENRMYRGKYSLLENLGFSAEDQQIDQPLPYSQSEDQYTNEMKPIELEVEKPSASQEEELMELELMNSLESMDNKQFAQIVVDDNSDENSVLNPTDKLQTIFSDLLADIFYEPEQDQNSAEEYD